MSDEFRNPFPSSSPNSKDCDTLSLADATHDTDEVLESSGSEDVMWSEFPGHRDTLALINFRQRRAALAIAMPDEILQQIYLLLSPLDFDAARRTCRKWFMAGLDKTMLHTMTQRAGCVLAATEDAHQLAAWKEWRRLSVDRRHSFEHKGRQIRDCHASGLQSFISDEWLLSKRLATEARITPGKYTEKGFMTVREEISFSALLFTPSTDLGLPVVRIFTVSSCGNFLLVNAGETIRVYSLVSSIRPISSLRCRHRVLAVSMDTSSGRYSVAILLEGRMGMCWDFGMAAAQAAAPRPTTPEHLIHYDYPRLFASDTPASAKTSRSASMAEYVAFEPRVSNLKFSGVPHEEKDADVLRVGLSDSPEETSLPDEAHHCTATYEQLGSPDDPPRSVAICPQRKCVAFGCGTGIELHWVDALTGGDLSRWFPLAAPSDYLYFLPQKQGVHSTKKLRLISSARGPSSMQQQRSSSIPASWIHNFRSSWQHPDRGQRRQSMTRLFFGTLPFPSATTTLVRSMSPIAPTDQDDQQGILRTVDCDHFRATPLSDGIHVLFTDPGSGLLCLGSDAPLGGSTKLIRKFVFLPPGYISTTTKLLPVCYAATQELRWGIRVVAAYADRSLVLFNIPSDCFNHVRNIRNLPDVWDENVGVFAQSDLLMDVVMDLQEHAMQDSGRSSSPGTHSHSHTHTHTRPFRTIQVPGIKFTTLDSDIDDMAVDCQNGGIRVWTFQANGQAQRWDAHDLEKPSKVRIVKNDGSIDDVSEPHQTKGKDRDMSSSRHVHFGGVDGTDDTPHQSETYQSPMRKEHKQVERLDRKYEHHMHRSFTLGAWSQSLAKDLLCTEDFTKCLAYRRMMFDALGSHIGSTSSLGSNTTKENTSNVTNRRNSDVGTQKSVF